MRKKVYGIYWWKIGLLVLAIAALLIGVYAVASKSYYAECRKEDKMTKTVFVKGMRLRVEMTYDGQNILTVNGYYAPYPEKCDIRVSKARYSRLLREYGMNEPSVLGPAWDWMLDQISRIMLPLNPDDSWGPYEYEVGADFKF